MAAATLAAREAMARQATTRAGQDRTIAAGPILPDVRTAAIGLIGSIGSSGRKPLSASNGLREWSDRKPGAAAKENEADRLAAVAREQHPPWCRLVVSSSMRAIRTLTRME
jgi:hypothetical protein